MNPPIYKKSALFVLVLISGYLHTAIAQNSAVPGEFTAPTSKAAVAADKKEEKTMDLFARNQQIISYLKLAAPVKNGQQYIVQIGKYRNIRNAERLVQQIQDKYDYPVKILLEEKDDLPLQTVYIGEFKTKEEAVAANENLKWMKRKGIVKKF